MKKQSSRLLALLLASALTITCLPARAGAAHHPQKDPFVTPEEIAHAQTSLELAREGFVLLENNRNALPIPKEGAVALFGIGSIQTTKGGTGSGAVNNRIVYEDGTVAEGEAISVSILDGFLHAGYQVLTLDNLQRLGQAYFHDTTGLNMGSFALEDDLPLEELFTEEELLSLSSQTDTAFYTVRRNAGEGADRRLEKDYCLSENELSNIRQLAKLFDKLVVLLNVVSLDASWFASSGADALLLVSNPGELGGDALVSVLNGEATPCGKLVDTWASSLEAWPSSRYYSNLHPEDPWGSEVEFYFEDIFVGYRYFDTFAADQILYDFGYGLSYTSFDLTVDQVQADEQRVSVTATVTNTGDYSGKEVVQVYFSAPQTGLPKPYQELAAYAKTDELSPGQAQTLTLSFPTTDMSSYSMEEAAYLMEAGDYLIRVGNSSRNTLPAACLTLDEPVLTRLLSTNLDVARYGAYPGGSSGQYDYLTQEGNAAQLEELMRQFQNQCDPSRGLSDPREAPLTISLQASSFSQENPYKEKGKEGELHQVPLYVSATTDPSLVTTQGYDYALGESYPITPVYFGADSAQGGTPEGELFNYRVKEGSEKEGTAVYYTLLDVQRGELTLEQFISGLSVEEMADLVEGGSKSPNAGGQSTGGSSPNTAKASPQVIDYINGQAVHGQAGQTTGLYIDSRKIPTLTNADGPAGLRVSQHYTEADGTDAYQFCTAYPIGMMIAQTWNTDLAYLMGQNVGEEMCRLGVTQWLAPGMNIHRNPLCGRNFEYYSEDPLVAGLTGGYEALGVQSCPGVGVTLKHFAGNDQENSRTSQNDVVTERALREIYLSQFELAVKLAKPMGIMTTYGLVNGVPTANDYELLENILRTEWGFDGLVMTDWGGSGGMTDAMAMHAGNDLIMPGGDVTLRILPYLTHHLPQIPLDEEGISLQGGYPLTQGEEIKADTISWSYCTTQWGDYSPDPLGSPYVVSTTRESFEGTLIPQVVETENGRGLTYLPVSSVLEGMKQEGTADYEYQPEDRVTITYRLCHTPVSDASHYAPFYQEHPATPYRALDGKVYSHPLSLADLQKSVERLLRVSMRTLQWQEILEEAGLPDRVGSYTLAAGGSVVPIQVERQPLRDVSK